MQSVYLQRIMKKNAAMGYKKQSQNKPNCFRPISTLNFNNWFYPAVFLCSITVKWTFGYEKDKESKFRSIVGTAQIYA